MMLSDAKMVVENTMYFFSFCETLGSNRTQLASTSYLQFAGNL